MVKTRISIVLIFLISSTIANQDSDQRIDESVFEGIVNSIKIRNFETEIDMLINSTDITYLVFYYNKASYNSKLGAYYLQRIDRKLDFFAKILLVDCDLVIPRNVSQCKIKYTEHDNFPQIRLLIPPLSKFDPQTSKMNKHIEINYSESTVNEELLYQFISDNVPSFSTQLNTKTTAPFINQPLFNKMILFTDKKKTPTMWRGLSNFFYDRILFGEVRSDNKELVEKYNITSFPSIIALKNPFLLKDNHEIHRYDGLKFPKEISKFIEGFALKEKNYKKSLKNSNIEKTLFKILNNQNFEEYFSENEDKQKLIYFLKDAVNMSLIPQNLTKFASLSNGYLMFSVFSCQDNEKICEKEFKVDVSNLPSLYLFPNSTDYYEMIKNKKKMSNSLKNLVYYFTKRIKMDVRPITNGDELLDFVNQDRKNEKYPVIYMHKNETKLNLPLHLISSLPEFKKKISFYILENPTDELLNILKLKYNGPFTIFLFHNKDHENSFRLMKIDDSVKTNFIGMKIFIDNIIGDYFAPKSEKVELKRKFLQLEESTTLYRRCIYGSHYCVFALLNGEYDLEMKRTNLNINKYLHNLNKFTSKNNPLFDSRIEHYFWVNATCFEEFSAVFNVGVSLLPTLVIYDPSNKMFSKFPKEEKFNSDNIERFLQKALEHKVYYRKLAGYDVIFKDKYCQGITKKVKDVDYEKKERIRLGLEDDDEDEEENKMKGDL